MADAILATDFGVTTDGQDAAGPLYRAMAAAIAEQTTLLLPAGTVRVSSLPVFTLAGKLAIRGLGRRVSILQFDQSVTHGLYFDGSQGKQLDNYVELSDFALVGPPLPVLPHPAQDPFAGPALSIDFGSLPIGGTGSNAICSMGHVENVEITSWHNGILLRNCWNVSLSRLFLCGGPGANAAITLAGCIAVQLSNANMSFWNKGLFFTQYAPGHACQGIQVSNVICEAVPLCLNNDTPDGALATPFQGLQVSNFAFDNGNTPDPGNCAVSLFNLEGLALVAGQILQKGGVCQTYLRNVVHATLSAIDFTPQDHGSPQTRIQASLVFDGTSDRCIVAGNQFGLALGVILNPQTQGNRVYGNTNEGPAVLDYGQGNLIGVAKA